MSDFAVCVRSISKAYRIWKKPASRLTAPAMEGMARLLPGAAATRLRRSAAKRYRDFWALKDISFEVGKGEAIGSSARGPPR